MHLLDEIIDLAASESGSVATLLRKCLILSHTLKNDRLKEWADNELNGYKGTGDAVPEYRRTDAPAKGLFVGYGGSQMNNQPIPPAMLQERHRRFAESMILTQPIAVYENLKGPRFVFEWPANLTVVYQSVFFEGYALNRAWQEVPATVLIGLIDTIKTKVLRFALELKDSLELLSDDLQKLPKDKIDQTVITYIFGGHNVIASRDFTQIHSIEIGKGDWAALAKALEAVGVKSPEIAALQSDLKEDSETGEVGLGQRTAAWLKQLGSKLGQAGLSIGIEVAKTEVTKWLHQYLGQPPS